MEWLRAWSFGNGCVRVINNLLFSTAIVACAWGPDGACSLGGNCNVFVCALVPSATEPESGPRTMGGGMRLGAVQWAGVGGFCPSLVHTRTVAIEPASRFVERGSRTASAQGGRHPSMSRSERRHSDFEACEVRLVNCITPSPAAPVWTLTNLLDPPPPHLLRGGQKRTDIARLPSHGRN